MKIEPITKEEFLALGGHSTQLSPEVAAVQKLKVESGVKFPCRWKHSAHGTCSGSNTLRAAASRHGFTVATKCREGSVFVWRLK